MIRRVTVALGERSYPIVIGNGIDDEIIAFVRQASYSTQGMIVTDANVGAIHADRVAELLVRAGVRAEIVTIPEGESSKSLAQANELFTRAIELGLDRKSPIFALGGGVVGDLAGFIAVKLQNGV